MNGLSESKNAYTYRLMTILTPLMIQGIKCKFDDICNMCIQNDEEDKYLMMFQKSLEDIPIWNEARIENETQRIINESKCDHLDLLLVSCINIQIKIYSYMRVSLQQKRIEYDKPSLNNFIHKCYIAFARKLYTNVYLFEKDIMPIIQQKHMRECELICRESIIAVIDEIIPIKQILNGYMEETEHEEVIEEIIEKLDEDAKDEEKEKDEITEESKELVEKPDLSTIKKDATAVGTTDTANTATTATATGVNVLTNDTQTTSSTVNENMTTQNHSENISSVSGTNKSDNLNLTINVKTEKDTTNSLNAQNMTTNNVKSDVDEIDEMIAEMKNTTPPETNKLDDEEDVKPSLSFNNNDSILDMGTNKESIISAPKTIERLEKISDMRYAKRKEEEEEYDDDEDEDERIVVSDKSIDLEQLGFLDLDKDDNKDFGEIEML
jgi:hypothetical protein